VIFLNILMLPPSQIQAAQWGPSDTPTAVSLNSVFSSSVTNWLPAEHLLWGRPV
jgi:hypothetical protein